MNNPFFSTYPIHTSINFLSLILSRRRKSVSFLGLAYNCRSVSRVLGRLQEWAINISSSSTKGNAESFTRGGMHAPGEAGEQPDGRQPY